MGLALAGALSGMGEGLGRGLFAMEQGFIQQGLMQEREKLEQARLEKTFAHNEQLASMREAGDNARAKLQADTTLQAASMREAGDTQRTGMTIEGQKDITNTREAGDTQRTGMTIAGQKEIHAGDNTARATEGEKDRAVRQEKDRADTALGKQKLANEKQHYKDWKDVYSQYAQARMTKAEGGGGSEKSNDQRNAIQYLGQLRQQIAGLEKSRAAASEDFNQARVDQIDSMLDDAYTEYNAVQGHVKSSLGITGAASSGGSGGIVDPRMMKSSPVSPTPSSRTTTPASPSSVGSGQPTSADMLDFQRQYDAAQQGRGSLSAVVESFKQRFGRVPTQADYDLLKRGSR